jgi:hypothetical protein
MGCPFRTKRIVIVEVGMGVGEGVGLADGVGLCAPAVSVGSQMALANAMNRRGAAKRDNRYLRRMA